MSALGLFPRLLAAFVLFAGGSAVNAEPLGKRALEAALQSELERCFAAYSGLEEFPVYYLAYRVTDLKSFNLNAAWGAVETVQEGRERVLDLDLRVGSPELDNTHRDAGADSGGGGLSLEDDEKVIRTDIWLETERRYRGAVEKYMKVAADRAVKVEEEDTSPDFSPSARVELREETKAAGFDGEAWSRILRSVSAVFRKSKDVLDSRINVSSEERTSYFTDSEGSFVRQFLPLAQVDIWASARADDGMDFTVYRSFPARRAEGLPRAEELAREASKMTAILSELRAAPLVDPYSGPAILSGRAAAVLFHEVLGHRLEGHRQKDEESSQTFTRKVNSRILPAFISVVSDPTLESIGATPLLGHYRVDDEGVRARSVTLVSNGVLKSFLMSRSPVRGFPSSNGHGRASAGKAPVSRQSSLIVKAREGMSPADLRRRMIALCREKNKPYGLIFEEIEGGLTMTGRTVPNAFNVMPVLVRRVYTDGRADELVRGVDLIGTPLMTLARIIAAGDDKGIFNGYCGAESGYVPVSAVSPSLLISEVEVQRKPKGTERLPILFAPDWGR